SEPALAQIVALRSAVIPVAGLVRNTNTLLGQDGITGLKTGSDTAAGGCILLAAWQQAQGHDTLIVVGTFGQPGSPENLLPNALHAGHQLVLALAGALAANGVRHTSNNKAEKNPPAQPPQSPATRRPRRAPDHARIPAGMRAV